MQNIVTKASAALVRRKRLMEEECKANGIFIPRYVVA